MKPRVLAKRKMGELGVYASLRKVTDQGNCYVTLFCHVQISLTSSLTY